MTPIKLKSLIEAITPEERKKYTDFAKILKQKLRSELGMDISVSTDKVVTSNPYIQIRVPGWKVNFIPNEFRKKIIDIVFPNAKILDPNDILYGNIQHNSITLKYSEWKKVFETLFPSATQPPESKFVVGEKVLYIDNNGQKHEASIESIAGKDEYIINYNNKKVKVSASELSKLKTEKYNRDKI